MSTSISDGRYSSGLDEELIRSGHQADDCEWASCRPDYPHRCACGRLIHVHAHAYVSQTRGESLDIACSCDRYSYAFQEEDIAEQIDKNEASD